MNNEIYKLAVSCKQFADKQIETYRLMAVDPQYGIEYQKSSGVRGDIKGYEKILIELRKAIAGKYTLIEKQLEEEMNSYDRHPILHQGKIEAIVLRRLYLLNYKICIVNQRIHNQKNHMME